MMIRVTEVATFGLLDHEPSSASPFLYVAHTDAGGRADELTLLMVLLEPSGAWQSATATEQAAELMAWVRQAFSAAAPDNVPARLHAVVDELNQHELNRARGVVSARASALGLTLVVLRGADLYVAQLPPGNLLVCQAGTVYAFPALDDRPEVGSDASDAYEPLGHRTSVAPRLLQTRVAHGDLVIVVSSTIAARAPRLEQTLSQTRTADEALTAIAVPCEHAGVPHGAVGVVRLGNG